MFKVTGFGGWNLGFLIKGTCWSPGSAVGLVRGSTGLW